MIGPSGTRLEGGEVGVGLVDGLGVRLVVLADIGPFAPPRTTWLILLSEWTVYERRPAYRRPDQPPSGRRHRPNATLRTGWVCSIPRSEQGVAHAQRPIAGRAELGQLALDVYVDGAEEVDVLAVRRRDVGQHLVLDAPGLARRISIKIINSANQ